MSANNQRVALIVRAANEVGGKLATELAEASFRIALNDLLPNSIEKISAELNARGATTHVHAADLTRKLTLQTMLQDILEAWGRIDILIFIANVQPVDAILDMDEWDWHRALDQNLTAAFLCTQSVGRVMRETGGGVIAYVIENDGRASVSYQTAAAALQSLGQAVSPELSGYNIQIVTRDTKEISASELVELLNKD